MAITNIQIAIGVAVLLAVIALIYWLYEHNYVPAQSVDASVTTASGTVPAVVSVPGTTLGKDGSATVPATVTTAAGSAVVPVTITKSGVDFATLSLSCDSGNILVNSATYAGGTCKGADNTAGIAALCNGHPSCTINILPSTMKMKNGQMGSLLPKDPCPGIKKTLKVDYTCQ